MADERTSLTPAEETAFQQWAAQNQIQDVDMPESFYDYRGYWKGIASQGGEATKMYPDGLHFTDQFKQHGHPTFSVESQYSRGDGGHWAGEKYVPQTKAGDGLNGTDAFQQLKEYLLQKAMGGQR